MSKALQCDRCGNFYKFKKMAVGDICYDLGIAVKLENGKIRGRMLDLCPKCQTELAMFVMGIPSDEYVIRVENE